MVWLPDGEKKFEDMFVRFDMIHERDRRTDGQTPHDGYSRAYAWHRAAKTVILHRPVKFHPNRPATVKI